MGNGRVTNGEKLDNIYFTLGKVHSDVKTLKGDVEEIKEMQESHSTFMQGTRQDLNTHLTYHETKRKMKKTQEQKQMGFIGFGIGLIAVVVNVTIEGIKVVWSNLFG